MLLLSSLLFGAALAGCAGNATPADTAAAAANSTTGSGSGVDAEGGIIEGSVTDEEVSPIEDVTIAILDLGIRVLTGADGRFRIADVPVGQYPIIATKAGYESQAKSAEVGYGVATEVSFLMAKLPTEDPFYEVTNHVALHHAGAFIYTTWAANMTGQSVLCSGCGWVVMGPKPADGVVLEIYGTHSVPSLVRPAQEHFWIFGRPNATGVYECQNAYQDISGGAQRCNLPIVLRLDKWRIGDHKGLFIQIMCDLYWFCAEERRDTWTTMFFNYDEMPADYSARPPA